MMTFLIINVVLIDVLLLVVFFLFAAMGWAMATDYEGRNARLNDIDDALKKSQSSIDSMHGR
jgi:cell division protein FtsX